MTVPSEPQRPEISGDSAMSNKLGILDQIAVASKSSNRLASIVGGVLGGFIPLAVYLVAHLETSQNALKWVLVAAGMLYSATTVYQWARIAFKHWTKAFGFVVLVEGVAVFATTPAISVGALAILVAVNAVSTAYNLVSERKLARAELKAATPARARKRTKKTLAKAKPGSQPALASATA